MVRKEDASAGVVLFNLLEEVMVRNTRPYIRAAYPNATIKGKPVAFPDRRLHTVDYDLGATYGGLYDEIVAAIDALSLAPYKLEAYKKKSAITDEEQHKLEEGREEGLVGIFKTRFLKRLESSIEAFRLSLRRALTFEETYKDYLLDRKVVSSKDFQKAMRFLARDEEDDIAAGSLADELDAVAEAREYIESLPTVDLNQYDLRKLTHDVEADVKTAQEPVRTDGGAGREGRQAGPAQGTAGRRPEGEEGPDLQLVQGHDPLPAPAADRRRASSLKAAGNPHIRRIDSGNHPDERGHILAQFAPIGSGRNNAPGEEIDILISTDVLSEGQNLQDCGVIINYDLTWNPIRLVQRNGRIDRIGSPHAEIGIYNMFPEEELEALLHLIERLTDRISTIDDLGLLDASVLGEVVHPGRSTPSGASGTRTAPCWTRRRPGRNWPGPEMLLKQLKDMLNRDGDERPDDAAQRHPLRAAAGEVQRDVLLLPGSPFGGRGQAPLLALHRRQDARDQGEPLRDRPADRLPARRAPLHRRPGRVRPPGQGDRAHPGRRAGGRGEGGRPDRRGSDPADGDRGDQGRHPPPHRGPGEGQGVHRLPRPADGPRRCMPS